VKRPWTEEEFRNTEHEYAQAGLNGMQTLSSMSLASCSRLIVHFDSSFLLFFVKIISSGCCGSVDGVKVRWDRTPIELHNLSKGKNEYCTLGFLVATNHRRRILHVTGPFKGNFNDLVRISCG
jgi:hypothetical protein